MEIYKGKRPNRANSSRSVASKPRRPQKLFNSHFLQNSGPLGQSFALDKLITMTKEEPDDLILHVIKEMKVFVSMLEGEAVEKRTMGCILTILGKASTSRLQSEVNSMINSLSKCKMFYSVHVSKYLASFHQLRLSDYDSESLEMLTELLVKFHECMPCTAMETASVLLPLLENTVKKFLKQNKKLCTLLEKIVEANTKNLEFQQSIKPKEVRYKTAKERLQLQKPPENYRMIPILPTPEDIHKPCVFLRPNLTKGEYVDVEHYLDVQFRLLREDYIRPLRDGISEYLLLKEKKQPFTSLQDATVHSKVQIVDIKIDGDNISHTAYFKDFSSMNWQQSKRFLYGSLLCFSDNDFQTFYLATVIERKEIYEGRLILEFENPTEEVLHFHPSRRFVVIETSAYFEAYKHNLTVLSLLDEKLLPMQQYIIKVKNNVDVPAYLKDNDCIDVRTLFDNSNEHGEYFMYRRMHLEYKNVHILDDESWPKFSDLNLDHFQFAAIKAALTKEFCIIQGPPGTGKTFIGLKIVRVLLANKRKWHSAKCPLLVVCYTNHALDQFLEGLLGFTKNIIRIGGLCSSPEIEHFNLKKLRKEKEYINGTVKELNGSIGQHRRKIKKLENSIEKTKYHILNENELEGFIPVYQFWSFSYLRELSSDEVENCITVWLKHGNEKPKGKVVGRKSKNSLKDILDSTIALSENEANTIKNLLIIPLKIRWSLYKMWIGKYIAEKRAKLLQSKAFLQRNLEELPKAQLARDVHLCREADVIGMTTTGAAKNKDLLNELDPKIVVVEEAAEILESHIVTSLSPGTEHVILIGDHQQLRPNPTVHSLAVNYDLNISLFERMIKNGIKYNRLNLQHRMRPEIASLLVPHFYEDLQNHASVEKFGNVKGMTKNMFFMSHGHYETTDNSKTKTNLFEAKFIVRLYKYLLFQGYKPSQITILTTYVGQMFTIRKELEEIRISKEKHFEVKEFKKEDNVSQGKEEMENDRKDEDVRVTVVDNYQGEENEIVLISFVRSNTEGRIGFLKISNRICVALSRAKVGFFGIGNFEFLANESDIWTKIIEKLKDQDAIGPSLQLKCQNHPDTFAVVKDYKDFNSVPEGGCTRDCDFRYECGHQCPLKCHPYNREHENIKCQKPCNKYCIRQHLCPKECYEDCGHCFSMVNKVVELCGHETEVFCYRKEENAVCPELCETFFSCLYSKSKIKGVLDNVFFVSCSLSDEQMMSFMKSFEKYLIQQSYNKSDVGNSSLIDILNPEFKGIDKDLNLVVFNDFSDTKEFIVASTVALTTLSNARKGLYCIGDFNTFAEKFEFWKRITDSLRRLGKIGPTLQLQCQNHPEICEVISNESDFRSVKDGGCTKQCEFKLACDHTCALKCHLHDVEHKNVQCDLPCMRKCILNHSCKKKCYENCVCTEMVDKKLESCGHMIKVMCCLQKEPHLICEELVTIKLPECHHDYDIMCGKQSTLTYFYKLCEKPCNQVLACGHVCGGTCGSCLQGRLHVSCKKHCKRVLMCGHKCPAPCFVACPPCERPCQEICQHGLCPCLCGEPCDPCMMKCEWKCPHKKCNNLCHEKCDRTPCDEPCTAKLKCGHKCIGLCGEPCPRKCKTCDKKLVRTLCEGRDPSNSKFVNLENCNHFFEVSELTERIIQDSNEYAIRHLKCPRCSKDILKNFRFGNFIKTVLEGFESVKKITSGDESCNYKLKFNLLEASKKIKISKIKKEFTKKCLLTDGSIRELNVLENFVAILLNFDSIFSEDTMNYEFKCKEDLQLYDSKTNQDSCDNLQAYIKKARECLIDFILQNVCLASKEQLEEFAWEAYRVALADKLLRTLNLIPKLTDDASQLLNGMMNSLLTVIPFRREDADEFHSTYEKFLALSSTPEPADVKIPSLKSVSSCQGTWLRCPKGHVFSSVTCLKTSEGGSCYECDPSIAIVQSSNAVPQEMKQECSPSNATSRFRRRKNPFPAIRPKYSRYNGPSRLL